MRTMTRPGCVRFLLDPWYVTTMSAIYNTFNYMSWNTCRRMCTAASKIIFD